MLAYPPNHGKLLPTPARGRGQISPFPCPSQLQKETDEKKERSFIPTLQILQSGFTLQRAASKGKIQGIS